MAPGQTDAQYLASVKADWNAVLEAQCNKLRDKTTTGERSTDVAIQRFAADVGWNPSSADGAPLQDGLFQSTALERVITRTVEKKRPEAGAGRVSKEAD
jgi:hypothetical protein